MKAQVECHRERIWTVFPIPNLAEFACLTLSWPKRANSTLIRILTCQLQSAECTLLDFERGSLGVPGPVYITMAEVVELRILSPEVLPSPRQLANGPRTARWHPVASLLQITFRTPLPWPGRLWQAGYARSVNECCARAKIAPVFQGTPDLAGSIDFPSRGGYAGERKARDRARHGAPGRCGRAHHETASVVRRWAHATRRRSVR